MKCILWNGVFSAIWNNKDVTAISDSSPPNVNFWAQEEQCLLFVSHPAAVTPYGEQGAKDVNNQIAGCWPQTDGVHTKGTNQWAQTPASSHTEESAKFLTWDIWFSLINNNDVCWCSGFLPLAASFYITWLLSLPPKNSFLRITWDAVYQAWSPKSFHQGKHNCQCLGGDYLSWQYQ